MKLDINRVFILTKYNFDLLNIILEYARPDRSFKSKTADIVRKSLSIDDKKFNPIIYKTDEYVVFWKTRKKMPLHIYIVYRKIQKAIFYKRWCNK